MAWKIDTELIYQKCLLVFGRVGLKHNIYLAYSYTANAGFIVIPDNDSRANNLDDKYDLISTYSGNSLPRLDVINEDIYAYLNEEAEKQNGIRPELWRFVEAG